MLCTDFDTASHKNLWNATKTLTLKLVCFHEYKNNDKKLFLSETIKSNILHSQLFDEFKQKLFLVIQYIVISYLFVHCHQRAARIHMLKRSGMTAEDEKYFSQQV